MELTMGCEKSEQLIREYCRTLTEGRADRRMVARDRDRLRFFLHAYLMEEWPRELDRVDSEIIRDFLGGWFLRHVGGTRSEIVSYLGTFHRFYDHLYQTGRLSAAEYDDLAAALAARQYFLARYDDYFRRPPDAWEDFAVGGPLRDGDPAPALGVDRQLWMLTKNLEHPDPAGPLDFSLFLDYLAHYPVRLTRAGRIPAGHLRRINRRFSRPEELPPRGRMEDSRRVSWFLRLAESLDLVRVDGGVITMAKRSEYYLDLDPVTRLAIMIEGLWNRLPWDRLGAPAERKLSQWACEHRDGFASLLADLTPGHEWMIDLSPEGEDPDALLSRYLVYHQVVSDHLLFALRELGLLDFSARREGLARSLTLSRLGRRVFSLYAGRARAGAPESTAVESLRGARRV